MRYLPWAAVSLLVALVFGCAEEPEPTVTESDAPRISLDETGLETFLLAMLEEANIPGVALAVVDRNGLQFSAGYGWADIDNQVPMTAETVMNVASISKTFTAAAVLQLRDRGLLDLDDDVNVHLPFAVRHPRFPDRSITIRQLLTHTSGIEDGEAYDETYACGDPAVRLADWIRGYFEPGGVYYDAAGNFLPTAPGEAYSYSNLGFGLLGYLVEVVSGEAFGEYTRKGIFEPLGMDETGWYLSDIAADRQATPYAWIEAGDTLDNVLFAGRNGEAIEEAGFVAFCPYSFYNIPDGLVRTSVDQLARYLVAHMRGGEIDGGRILAESTVAEALSPQLEPSMIEGAYAQGLAWRRLDDEELGAFWSHSGGDPGARTRMLFNPETGIGVIVFANRAAGVNEIVRYLYVDALE